MVARDRVRRSCRKYSSPDCCPPRWVRGMETYSCELQYAFTLSPFPPHTPHLPPSPHLPPLTCLPLLLNLLPSPFPSLLLLLPFLLPLLPPLPPASPPPSTTNLLPSTAYPPAIRERPIPRNLRSSSRASPPEGRQVPL